MEEKVEYKTVDDNDKDESCEMVGPPEQPLKKRRLDSSATKETENGDGKEQSGVESGDHIRKI